MDHEYIFGGERLRWMIQDVLIDGVGYDESRWGARGYRFHRRIDMEQERHGIIVLGWRECGERWERRRECGK